MSMYLGCDLIVDGDERDVARAVAVLTRDGGHLVPGAYVQCVRRDDSEPPRVWWAFEFREQHLDLVEAACSEAAASGDAMVSLEWYASHRLTCGGIAWRVDSATGDEPVRWQGVYRGLRGG